MSGVLCLGHRWWKERPNYQRSSSLFHTKALLHTSIQTQIIRCTKYKPCKKLKNKSKQQNRPQSSQTSLYQLMPLQLNNEDTECSPHLYLVEHLSKRNMKNACYISPLPMNSNILLCKLNLTVWAKSTRIGLGLDPGGKGSPTWILVRLRAVLGEEKLSLSDECGESYFSSFFILTSLWWTNWALAGIPESSSHWGLPVSVSPEPTDAEGEVGGWQEAPWPRILQRGWLRAGPLKPAPFGCLPCGRCASPSREWPPCFCVFERVLSPVLTCWSHWRLEKGERGKWSYCPEWITIQKFSSEMGRIQKDSERRWSWLKTL